MDEPAAPPVSAARPPAGAGASGRGAAVPVGTRLLEAVAVGAASGALGAAALAPLRWSGAGALVAGANGVISGWRGVYDWRRATGWAGAALDATWGILGTAAGLAVHAASARSGGYLPELSERRGRHVYRRGWAPRRGFAFAAGNVITNAGDPARPRRRALVERHETLHVWQQRLFGPVFPAVYVLWAVGGALTGTAVWLVRREPDLYRVVERHAYYHNPFERWAYAADGNWPPPALRRPTPSG